MLLSGVSGKVHLEITSLLYNNNNNKKMIKIINIYKHLIFW